VVSGVVLMFDDVVWLGMHDERRALGQLCLVPRMCSKCQDQRSGLVSSSAAGKELWVDG
jgi:hypothetical protein